ncbi:MAG: thiamine ABC transporter substrate-binding protein [Candidatus Promineifilaceae bacterium]|nr:thiamine ABC transporter substrate-binding protein [Candidatus Promineifilaceae bacterium]
MTKIMHLFVLTILLFATACGVDGQETSTPDDAGETGEGEITELSLMTHDSFAISEEVLAEFEAANDVRIELLPAGDAGAALNQAILAKDEPLADLFFGVDNTFMGRALAAELFVPYETPTLSNVPEALQLDDSHRLTPVDYGDVCLNYDKAYFEENDLAPPTSLRQLTEAPYEGLTVVENPATSSPGLAFLLATVGQFGTTGEYDFLDFWADMRANDVLVTDGWEDAYYGQFSAASDGDRPIVVSYASSPPAEVLFSDPPVDEPPTASVAEPGTCFRQIEFVGILAGTEQLELAKAFVDFMLSVPFQEDIPLNMFVFPANEQAVLPEVFQEHARLAQQPVVLDPQLIDENREEWIQVWTDTVLR